LIDAVVRGHPVALLESSEGAGKNSSKNNEENRASSNEQWLLNARLAPFFAITVALWFSPNHRFPAFNFQFLHDFCMMADMSHISAIEIAMSINT
jgi:hypothetical protein